MLSPMEAGGPYSMEIDGSNHLSLTNILIGDVWICSGQSNMVLPMERVKPLYNNIIAHSANTKIRQFLVPERYNFNAPQHDFKSGAWEAANPWSVLHFTATGYFFAKALFDKYHVPIGLINASVGGTPISAWMSKNALKEFPSYINKAKKFARQSYVDSLTQKDNAKATAWNKQLWNNDKGLIGTKPWFSPSYDTSGWSTMSLPDFWRDEGLNNINGVVWFRKEFTVPNFMAGEPAKLLLGRIVDADYAYVNGVFIGTTSYQYPPRRYTIAHGILKAGKNSITVRVINYAGKGGFIKDKPYEIIAGNRTIDLKGQWKYKLGYSANQPLHNPTFIQYQPEGLFNGMIAPLLNYTIKGAIWYQGESNTGEPAKYRQKFSAMIKDWRDKWDEGTFPFLFVQLPNYGKPGQNPSASSGWARIREAQRKTLALANTGMAITIDIGEWNDVHPLDKEDVGKRLAFVAQRVAYGNDKQAASGPIYQSMKKENHKIILTFFDVEGNRLVAKNNVHLQTFVIAGKNKNFVKAQAKIIAPNKVEVWSKQVAHPVTVRYAWANNPQAANLYNEHGLPASPFIASK